MPYKKELRMEIYGDTLNNYEHENVRQLRLLKEKNLHNKLGKYELINHIENRFIDYNDRIELDCKGMVISGEDKRFVIGINNKFSKAYCEKIIRRMRYLNYKYKSSKCVLLTLTVDEKNYDNFVDMWLDVKKQHDRFLQNLRIYFKKQEKVLPSYLSTIECQRNGNPHIHIVFFNATRILDWKKTESLWKLGFIWYNRTKDRRKIRKPIDYITKYITKSYTDTSRDNIREQSVKWIFNIRSYSCTRGLVYPLNYSDKCFNRDFFVYADTPYILRWFKANSEQVIDYIINDILKNRRYIVDDRG